MENFGKAARLREQLKRLWDKLDIEDCERKRCSAACSGFTPSVILKVSNALYIYKLGTQRCFVRRAF